MILSLRNRVVELVFLLWRQRWPTPAKPSTLTRTGPTERSGPSVGHAVLNGVSVNEGLTAFQLQIWALLPSTHVIEEAKG